MEKSIANIEKHLTSKKDSTSKGSTGKESLLSPGILSLSTATSIFNSTKGKELLSFTSKLIKIINTVDVEKAESFGKFADGVSSAITTLIDIVDPAKLIKLYIGSALLLGSKEGKDSLLSKIVKGISNAFKGVNSKQISKGAEAMKVLADGLSSLVKAFSLMAVIGLMAPLVAVGALVTWTLLKLFIGIGKHAKSYREGGKALESLGKGLIAFSAGLATLMLVITLVTVPKLIGGIAVIAAFTLTFALLGQVNRQIQEGGKALAHIGIGLFLFSAALATYMLVLMIVSIPTVLKGILVLGLIAAAFAGIGFLDKKGFVKDGAKALIEIGVGLIAVSVGILAFALSIKLLQTIFKDNLGEAGLIAGTILVGLAGAFAITGKFAGQILPGATAMISVGFALMSISGGILLFGLAIKALQNLFEKEEGGLPMAGKIAGGILLGLGLAFAGIGFAAPWILPGATAMISVGLALMSISGGIILFGLAIKALQALFPKKVEEAGVMGGKILLGLGLAFAAIGLLSIAIIPGAAAGITMGIALASISFGLWVFGNTLDGLIKKRLVDNNGEFKAMNVLYNTMAQFSKMFFVSLVALPGIAATVAMGISLMVIAKGLKAVGEVLSDFKPIDVRDKLFGKSGIISILFDEFGKIGKGEGSGLAKLGSLAMMTLGIDPVSRGIKAVKGLGDVLQELAGGIVAFSNFTRFPIQVPDGKGGLKYAEVDILKDVIPSLSANLPLLLTALKGPFEQIGKTNDEGNGWFSEKNPIKRGINAIKGLGGVLSELAGGIAAFSDPENFPVQIAGKDGKLIYTSVNLTTLIPKITDVLINEKTGILFPLSNAFAEVGKKHPKGFLGGDSDTAKGVAAVSGIGSVLSELASGILGFAEIERGLPIFDKNGRITGYDPKTKLDITKLQTTISSVLNAIPNAFASIDDKKLNAAKGQATSMNDIIKSLKELSKLGDGLNKFADSLTKAGNSFSTFAGGFGTFSKDLDKFQKFETSFSKLMKNQHEYSFDKFSKSMGELKTNVNAFEIEKLRVADSLMKSMAIISKAPEALGSSITETLEKSFGELIKAIKELSGETTSTTTVSKPASDVFKVSNTGTDNSKLERTLELLTVSLANVQNEISSLNKKFVRGVNGGILIDGDTK